MQKGFKPTNRLSIENATVVLRDPSVSTKEVRPQLYEQIRFEAMRATSHSIGEVARVFTSWKLLFFRIKPIHSYLISKLSRLGTEKNYGKHRKYSEQAYKEAGKICCGN